jgi:hypothetical protein
MSFQVLRPFGDSILTVIILIDMRAMEMMTVVATARHKCCFVNQYRRTDLVIWGDATEKRTFRERKEKCIDYCSQEALG